MRWTFFFSHLYFPASGQAVVTSVVPSPSRFLSSILIAHGVQQSLCSSIFHRVWLTHALALSASQCVHKKKPSRIYTSVYSGGFEVTKLTYTRLEDNLIRHRGDRTYITALRHSGQGCEHYLQKHADGCYTYDRGATIVFSKASRLSTCMSHKN